MRPQWSGKRTRKGHHPILAHMQANNRDIRTSGEISASAVSGELRDPSTRTPK